MDELPKTGQDLEERVPQWYTLFRIAPISVWSVGLAALGWWARGEVDAEFIQFLRDMCVRGGG